MHDVYLHMVRAALWQQPLGQVTCSEEQLQELLRIHMQQGTAALVFPLLLQEPLVSSYARTQMLSVCAQTMQQQVQLQHILTKSWAALEQAGIQPVLLKGAGLAALYPEMHQRAWGDIDLFVGKANYHTACATMRACFPDALKFDEELEHYKHYNLIADGVSIELHRVTVDLQHPLDARRYAEMEAWGMAHSEPLTLNGLPVRVPAPTFNVLFVFLHAWEHMLTQGANMRQLCDLALLQHRYRDTVDERVLLGWLKSLRLLDVWQLVQYCMVQSLGLPRPSALFFSTEVADRAERLLADLLESKMRETKEEKEEKRVNRFVRKWETMKGRNRNAARIAQYSPQYARHMRATTWWHGLSRLFAKDRKWE